MVAGFRASGAARQGSATGSAPTRSASPARVTVITPTSALPISGLKTITRGQTNSITSTGLVTGARVSLSRALGRAKPVVTSRTSTGTWVESRLGFTRGGSCTITASASGPNDDLRALNGAARLT
jgi:hypothetical protein